MQWKGVVENQELHLATSLARTLGEKVSRRCGSSFANFYGEFEFFVVVVLFSCVYKCAQGCSAESQIWCITFYLNID